MQYDFHWKTETTEVSRVSTNARTSNHTSTLLNRSFLKALPFARRSRLGSSLRYLRMKRNRLKEYGITNAFRGARTGDFWLMATGLFLWRLSSRRRNRRRL